MKLFVSFILHALLAYAIGLFSLPWFGFIITSAIIAFAIPQKPIKSFFSAFLALFLLWFLLAVIIDTANEHLLSQKVAQILPLKGNYWLLIVITSFVGGLLAAFSALTGSLARKLKKYPSKITSNNLV